MEKRKRKKESNFPWWEKRQQAMERKHGLQESGEYFRLGNREEKARSSQVKWKEPVQSGQDAVKLSAQQKYVLDLIRQGKNVFYTGNAGTGKTTLLREIQKCAPEGTFVTALTGVAAVQAGGMTLHSFAGIGLGNGTKEDLCGIVLRGQKAKNWRNANVLIIDEVSMLDGKLFDKLDYIACKVRQCDKPFGGLQLVLCGDFFQLPPIQKVGETSVNYCFQSQAWEKVLDYSLELTQIYRQSDPKLIKLLNEVRYQSVSAESLELLKYLKRPLKSSDIEPTKLYSHNKSVNDINNRKLDSLDGEEKIYYASDHGQSPYKENLSKYVIAMEKLVLKKGAQVMLLKNLTEELINGSRGVVEGFDEEGWPKVKFTDGTLKTITVVDWNLENSSGIVLARRIQVPLKLAWAITIHKSQGMSIDLLQVDLKQVFSQGQAYVALSRARTLEGLQVLTFDETRFTTSDAVIKFYKNKIQKAPESQDANSPQEASSCSSIQQSANQGDATATPSRKRMSEVKAGSSAKKRFSPSSTTNGHSSKAKHKLFYPSEKTSSQEKFSWSCQGESSSMVSSSPHVPYAKSGFRKGSELYLGSPAKKDASSQPFLIEEATDEECLLANPTPSCLVVKRSRPTLSSSLKHSIYDPKDDEIISSTNNERLENNRQDTGSCNRQNGISRSMCTKGEQDGPSCNSSCDQQDVHSWNNSCDQQYDSSCNRKPSRRQANRKAARSSSNVDSGSPVTKSPFNKESIVVDTPSSEVKFERQREKSKRKCSILFDALKSAESKEDVGNATSMGRKSKSSERNQSSIDIDVSADNNRAAKRQRKGNKRTTNIQILDDKNPSKEMMAVRNDTSTSQEASVYIDCKPKYESSMSVDDESKRRSTYDLNDSFFPVDHHVSPSDIKVACKWSRERSKNHCRKLFEALKDDDDTRSRIREEEQQEPLLPYYADKNVIDLTNSGPPSASIKLHQLCKSISENIFVNKSGTPNSLEYARYSPQGETGKHKTNIHKNYKEKDVSGKDTQTEHGSSRCHGDKVSVGKEAFTQTDTYQCESCLGVEDTPSATDSFSRHHSSDISDLGVLRQTDTCSSHYSIKKSNDLSGMFLEFKVPSVSFAVAQLKNVLLLMFYLAAVISSLSVQVFYSQFED